MIPVDHTAIQARKRPLAVLFVYGAELVAALIMAAPAHAWARRVWGGHPEGDAVLFRSGGRELLVWLGQTDASLAVTARTTMLLLLVGAVLMQLPLGALLASLAFSRGAGDAPEATHDTRRSLRLAEALRAGITSFMPLAGALALGTLASLIVLALGAMAAAAVERAFTDRLGDARAFQLQLATLALFLFLTALIGVVIDLARAAIVRESTMAASKGHTSPAWTVMLRGLKIALRASRRNLLRATLAWATRGAIGLALLAVGYFAAQALGGRGGTALLALVLLHQLIVLGRVALRASWLARALALIAPLQDALPPAPLVEPADASEAP